MHPAVDFLMEHVDDVPFLLLDPWLTVVRANDVAKKVLLINDDDGLLKRNFLCRLCTDSEFRQLVGSQWGEKAPAVMSVFFVTQSSCKLPAGRPTIFAALLQPAKSPHSPRLPVPFPSTSHNHE